VNEHAGHILVIDDEAPVLKVISMLLRAEGHNVSTAESLADALALLKERTFDLVFADIMLGEHTGLEFLRIAREQGFRSPVIMITGVPQLATAAEALKLGAFDYIAKPITREVLLHACLMGLRHRQLEDQLDRTRRNLETLFRSVGDGVVMVDSRLQVMEFNEAAGRLFALSGLEKGRQFRPGGSRCGSLCRELLEKTLSTGTAKELEYAEGMPSGEHFHTVRIHTFPIHGDSQDGEGGAVLIVRDQTRLAVLEGALRERKRYHGMVGADAKMQRVYDLIDVLRDVDSTVLITGESGTGKELVAEALHFLGARASQPLVRVNCTVLSDELLESELFGHIKGAFTGAHTDRRGRFESADGGTVFLDEIGDTSPRMQGKLLRVLQAKEFERVGEDRPIHVDVRLIAATNRDLKERVAAGLFRQDLYYRLKVIEVNLPPLRERRGDIPLLAEHFRAKFAAKLNKILGPFDSVLMRAFLDHPWPGNVRELEHVLEYAAVLNRGEPLTLEGMPSDFRAGRQVKVPLHDVAMPLRREALVEALEFCLWNKACAARRLGVSRTTLYTKMREFNVSRPLS